MSLVSKKDFAEHKARAEVIVRERIEYFNTNPVAPNGGYHFAVGKVTVRNQRSRWGSCSRKGNLNFNYRIALLPAHLADYVIVHELCHLGEFNHSRAFWNLVAQAVPDYAKCRAELRRIRMT